MLEVRTPFIWNLEGFCTYSGSLTQLYVGVATPEAFSPSPGKASANNVMQNSSSWSRPRIFSFGETTVSASPPCDLCQRLTLRSSLKQTGQSSLYRIKGRWKVSKLSHIQFPEPKLLPHSCICIKFDTLQWVFFKSFFFTFNPRTKWKGLWKVWSISIIGKRFP